MQKRAIRSLFFVPVAALFAVACGPGESTEPDAGSEPETGCQRNIECGGGSICEIKPGEDYGVCLKILCTNDSDCAENKVCDAEKQICVPKDLCDPGNSADVCGDEACTYVDGLPLCTPFDSLPAPTACRISPSPVIVSDGATIELNAAGLDGNKKLVPHVSFTYAQTGNVGSVSGNKLTASCATGVCTGTVTATASRGNATCTADVKVYAAPAANELRVILVDTTTGQPIAGAPTAITVNGAAIAAGSPTDANGVAVFSDVDVADVEAVSAFPANHQWQTVVSPGTNNVALYTVPIPDETKVAGVKGTFDFSKVTTQGDIKLGLAGMSIGGAITDLDFSMLVGEIADYNIKLDGVTDADGELVPLPSGLVLELGAEKIKGDFVTLGDEGLRVLWALGGRVRLSQIGSIISSVTASSDINVGKVLSAVLPFFAKFDHAVQSGHELSSVTRPASPGEDIPIPFEDWNFPTTTVQLNTLITQKAVYNVPTLPCVPGQRSGNSCSGSQYASGAVLLSGVVVPGIGLVPLGLTAGLDDPDTEDANNQRDGKLDYLPAQPGDPTPPAPGTARIDYAPPHDGLEGNLFVTIAIALDIDGLTSGSLGASTITHVTRGFSSTNSFPKAFLEHQGGTWDISDGNNKVFTLDAVGNADFYRLNLNNGEREWNIWFPAGTTTVNVSALQPASVTDNRAYGADVQAFALGTGYDGVVPGSYRDLIELNGTNFDNLLYYMGGWSSQACSEPDAEIPTPHCTWVR